MSIRHSKEHLPPQAKACSICKEGLLERDDILITACSHNFHRICLLNWLKKNPSCPQCRARCTSRDFSQITGARTRSRTALQSDNPSRDLGMPAREQAKEHQTEGAASLPGVDGINISRNASEEENRMRKIVSAVISARQASLLGYFESRVKQLIEQKIENTLTNLLDRLNLNGQPAQPSASLSPTNRTNQPNLDQPNISTPVWARETPNLPN
ncbi:PREDICTED: E3 ubiquitin-protein ligase RING1-like, partial [Rhagoletis zephyria]|uniref:E3 ubiquitin-protein ligase RING1-like n=1 Tax=Rhagoletis zephyria TaxID=28612 RepID=UPI0008117C5D